jgi:tetratricopeptide (TPR) repeat protein
MKPASLRSFLLCSLFVVASTTALAAPASFDAELLAIQQAWAAANYQTPAGSARETAFASLSERATAFTQRNPGRPEALVWEGIVLSTYAGAKGGLGALGLAKQARDRFEAALKIDGTVLDGSAYTSLGSLYSKVPGFPIGFGNDKKAREYLEKGVALNPAGIDSNYFYGEYLYDHGDAAQALRYLEKALAAAPRPDRESADSGRRQDIAAVIAKVKSKQG